MSEAQTYVTITLRNLDVVLETRNFFTLENFTKMKSVAAEETLNVPPSSRIRAQPFIFDEFENNTFVKFIDAFKAELNEAFSQIKFWSSFGVFDPQKLPEDLASITLHGNDELSRLLDHYGSSQTDTFQLSTRNPMSMLI